MFAGAEIGNNYSDSAKAERTGEDIAAHAILAEAALQAALELDERVIASQAILEKANEYIPEFSLKVPNLRLPKLYDIIRPTILATILDSKKPTITLPKIGQLNLPLPTTFSTESNKFERSNSKEFITYLAAASRNPSSAEFSLKPPKHFPRIPSIPTTISEPFNDIAKSLEDAAKKVLSEEAKKAAAQAIAAGIKALSKTRVPEVSVPGKDSLDGSIERAMLAEAVLAAVTAADANVLQAEGFFDTLLKVATDLAPKILPPVIGRTSGLPIFDIINKSLLGHNGVGNGFVVVPGTETGQSESQSDLAAELWSILKASSAVMQ